MILLPGKVEITKFLFFWLCGSEDFVRIFSVDKLIKNFEWISIIFHNTIQFHHVEIEKIVMTK